MQHTYDIHFIPFTHVLTGLPETPVSESSVTRIPNNLHGEYTTKCDRTRIVLPFQSCRDIGIDTDGQANASTMRRHRQCRKVIRQLTLCSPRCGKRKRLRPVPGMQAGFRVKLTKRLIAGTLYYSALVSEANKHVIKRISTIIRCSTSYTTNFTMTPAQERGMPVRTRRGACSRRLCNAAV